MQRRGPPRPRRLQCAPRRAAWAGGRSPGNTGRREPEDGLCPRSHCSPSLWPFKCDRRTSAFARPERVTTGEPMSAAAGRDDSVSRARDAPAPASEPEDSRGASCPSQATGRGVTACTGGLHRPAPTKSGQLKNVVQLEERHKKLLPKAVHLFVYSFIHSLPLPLSLYSLFAGR